MARQRLVERAAAISAAYRTGVTSAKAITAEADALAYALARMPATYAACRAAFEQARRIAPGFAPRRLTDAGAGPGAAAWAALETWPGLGAIVQLDANAPFLALSARLAQAGPQALRDAEVRRGDLVSVEIAQADLVTASYVLAEIPAGGQAPLVDRLWSACTGVLVLVEPGTPAGFERLRDARRRLVSAGATVLAPCAHDSDCPIAAPDWCHFAQRLPRSRDHRLAKSARLAFEDEKFAYVAAARPHLLDRPRPARVLAPPRMGKAGVTLTLCTPAGAEARTVARRDKAAFAGVRRLGWGDGLGD